MVREAESLKSQAYKLQSVSQYKVKLNTLQLVTTSTKLEKVTIYDEKRNEHSDWSLYLPRDVQGRDARRRLQGHCSDRDGDRVLQTPNPLGIVNTVASMSVQVVCVQGGHKFIFCFINNLG